MPQVFAVAELMKPVRSGEISTSWFDHFLQVLETIPGFNSATLWRSQAHSDRTILLTHYDHEEAAQQGVDQLGRENVLVEIAQSYDRPMDLRRATLFDLQGRAPGDLEMESFLSFSERTSEPGFGKELAEELQRIFGELSVIPGFEGSMVGNGINLPEEVMGLVFWSKVEAFMQSLPLKVLYEVKLFHRIR